jgi:hypothetical protein
MNNTFYSPGTLIIELCVDTLSYNFIFLRIYLSSFISDDLYFHLKIFKNHLKFKKMFEENVFIIG